jgi:hypothetical protein
MYPAQAPASQAVFVAEPDLSHLSTGRHTLFVRGLNLTGDPGPTSSVFFIITDPADPGVKFLYIPVVTTQ